MSKTITLPDDVYARLERQAAARGLDVAALIAALDRDLEDARLGAVEGYGVPPTRAHATLLTLEQAALRLGVEPSLLDQWAEEGRVDHVRRSGGARRFKAREIERWRKELPFIAPSPWADALERAARGEQGEADSPLIQRLDRVAEALARGRMFEDSTEIIRAAREGVLGEHD